MEEMNMDEQCRRAEMLAAKKKKGPLVKKTGTKFDSASHELQKNKKPEESENSDDPQ
jgi:hypothetical protein